MCNVPRSLSDDETKQVIYYIKLMCNICRSLTLDEQRNKRDK